MVERYNSQAEAVTSLNASITLTLTAGSAYTGLIKQYHQVKGFILAQKPASIRVIGQAPIVGTSIFDMESDGETFRIFIPSQHKFITGPVNLERASAKPIENLRPQHLTGAIFWQPIPEKTPVLFEEAVEGGSQYYVLTVVRPGPGEEASDYAAWEIAKRIWFDRADLDLARQETYEAGGQLGSDIEYSGWATFGGVKYPRKISLARPTNDYTLQIGITKADMNETISADRFVLKQPPGTELVNLSDQSDASKSWGTEAPPTNAPEKNQ